MPKDLRISRSSSKFFCFVPPSYSHAYPSLIICSLSDISSSPTYNQQAKGEIDVWNPHHLINLQMMFERNKKIEDIENNATKPSDAINSALDNFWEKQDGSNDPSKQKELL